jgi:hypothetical protein
VFCDVRTDKFYVQKHDVSTYILNYIYSVLDMKDLSESHECLNLIKQALKTSGIVLGFRNDMEIHPGELDELALHAVIALYSLLKKVPVRLDVLVCTSVDIQGYLKLPSGGSEALKSKIKLMLQYIPNVCDESTFKVVIPVEEAFIINELQEEFPNVTFVVCGTVIEVLDLVLEQPNTPLLN